MWEVRGTPVDAKRFAPFEPLRILNYCDGPRIFTFRDAGDAAYLACWSDEGDGRDRFLVVPVTDAVIADLESGNLTVRDALLHSPMWVVDVGFDAIPIAAWLVAPNDLPDDAQPQPGAMLHRSGEVQSKTATVPPISHGIIAGLVDVSGKGRD